MAASSSIARRLRVGFLMASASRRGGGVFEALRNHVLALGRGPDIEPMVFALEDGFTAADSATWGGVPVITRPVSGPGVFGYAPHLLAAMLAADLDILHLHGLWMYPSAAAAAWASRTGRASIVSPHGMLEPWITRRGRWKKAIARAAYEHRNWRSARAFHALTAAEAADIRAAVAPLGVLAETIVVPNGVTLGPARIGPPPEPPTVVFIGRIHPKKNLDALIDAWTQLGLGAKARLTIAGWGDVIHVAAFETKLARASDPSIVFLGPVHGSAKQALLIEARFLVLPSFSEGLPMTVLEAWAVGTPTLMTAACNLSAGFVRGAALEIPTRAEDLAPKLREALSLDDDRWRHMSASAQALVRDNFSSDVIAGQWVDIYRGLADARPVLRAAGHAA